MLKSLLLDRMKRKRSSSIDTDATSKKSSSSSATNPGESSKSSSSSKSKPIQIPEAPNDILRKRLLGWVDPPQPQDAKKPEDKVPPPSRSQSNKTEAGQVFHLDLEPSEEANNNTRDTSDNQDASKQQSKASKRDNVVTYANTSVLKHLLHRYTETKQ